MSLLSEADSRKAEIVADWILVSEEPRSSTRAGIKLELESCCLPRPGSRSSQLVTKSCSNATAHLSVLCPVEHSMHGVEPPYFQNE